MFQKIVTLTLLTLSKPSTKELLRKFENEGDLRFISFVFILFIIIFKSKIFELNIEVLLLKCLEFIDSSLFKDQNEKMI